MPKNTLTVPKPVRVEADSSQEVPVRVEESVEEFLTLHLPEPTSEKLEIKNLWTDKSGSRFFRCNYWKISDGCYGVLTKSLFVRVDRSETGNVFVKLS